MSFIKRKINVTLSYGTGPQGLDTPKVVELTGHRAICNATAIGGAGMGGLQLRIYGLTLDLMSELSTVGKMPQTYPRNQVAVYAGDDANGMSLIFYGTVTAAYADMMTAPEVAFVVIGAVGVIEALLPVPPTSWPGSVDAADILKTLADQMGMAFENNGVSVILRDAYFPGSPRAQALACVKAANITWNGLEKNTLAIWPKGASRSGTTILISTETGMVGYPTYTATGIFVTVEYNPAIEFGALVEVQSIIKQANGIWRVLVMTNELSAELPDGPWFTQLQLVKPELLIVGH